MAAKQWTKGEVSVLRSQYGARPTRKIAAELGRTPMSVYVKAHALGLTRRNAVSQRKERAAQAGEA